MNMKLPKMPENDIYHVYLALALLVVPVVLIIMFKVHAWVWGY